MTDDALPELPTLDRPRRLTDAERKKIGYLARKHYIAGASITELAVLLGCSYGFARTLLVRVNTKFRNKAGKRV